MEITSRVFCSFALPPPQTCPGSPVTPQRERSRKCSHLETYRSQAPFQTLSPSFRGKGKGAFIHASGGRPMVMGASVWDPPISPALRAKAEAGGSSREASLVCTGQPGTTARCPGPPLQPRWQSVTPAAVGWAGWGHWSPVGLETHQLKPKFCDWKACLCRFRVSFQAVRSSPPRVFLSELK